MLFRINLNLRYVYFNANKISEISTHFANVKAQENTNHFSYYM